MLCFSTFYFKACGLQVALGPDFSLSWVKGSCALGLLSRKERRTSFPACGTSSQHFLPALLAQTLIVAPSGGNLEQLPYRPRASPKAQSGTQGRLELGCYMVRGGATPTKNRLQSGTTDYCHAEYRPHITSYFGFPRQARNFLLKKPKPKPIVEAKEIKRWARVWACKPSGSFDFRGKDEKH